MRELTFNSDLISREGTCKCCLPSSNVSILSLGLNSSVLFNFKDGALFNFQFILTNNKGIKFRRPIEEIGAIKRSKYSNIFHKL